MDAEAIKVLIYVVQAIFLVFAIMYTFVAIRGTALFVMKVGQDKEVKLPAKVIILPAVLWGIFFFLTKASFSIQLFINFLK